MEGTRTAAAPPLVILAASSGGPAALAEVLSHLPSDWPAAVVVVQHVAEMFATSVVEWLASRSPMPARGARPGDPPQPGMVLIAEKPGHLKLTRAGLLVYSEQPATVPYRPSVDVFFESVVEHWRGRVVAVLLTGMGSDGAKGLKALREMGAETIAQDRESSAVYGMPKAAAKLDAARHVLPLRQIGPTLMRLIPPRRQGQ